MSRYEPTEAPSWPHERSAAAIALPRTAKRSLMEIRASVAGRFIGAGSFRRRPDEIQPRVPRRQVERRIEDSASSIGWPVSMHLAAQRPGNCGALPDWPRNSTSSASDMRAHDAVDVDQPLHGARGLGRDRADLGAGRKLISAGSSFSDASAASTALNSSSGSASPALAVKAIFAGSCVGSSTSGTDPWSGDGPARSWHGLENGRTRRGPLVILEQFADVGAAAAAGGGAGSVLSRRSQNGIWKIFSR